MTITKIRGIYQKGVIKPLGRVVLPDNAEVVITVLGETKGQIIKDYKQKFNDSFGILTDLTNGLAFVKKLRKENDKRLARLHNG